MRRILALSVLVLPCLLSRLAPAAEVTAGNLTLQVDDRLHVTGLKAGPRQLPVAPGPLLSLCPVATGTYAPATVTGGDLATGLKLAFPGTQTTGVLTLVARDGALRFAVDLQGEEVPARGMLLRFSFPVDATGWRWYSDMQSASTIAADKVYENVVPLRAYADLPEWKDKPALRMGYCNRNFCTVLAGPAGLAWAAPLDRPCIFRTAYDGPGKRLDLIYDFALTPDSATPNAVNFAFDLYECDPAWGLRSALATYYALYPALFKVWIRQQGQWMAFNRLSEIDNANEFWFALQEGAPEVSYDDKIDVLSTIYYTHAGMWGTLPPPYDPEKDPLPPLADQVAAINTSFKNITKLDGLYEQVGTRRPDGRLAVEKWSVYAHLIAQFNLDPDLPWGDFLIQNTATRTEQAKTQNNGILDGFYYDGLTAGLNYHPEHFRTHAAPILWDPANGKPFINNFYSSVEFARATAERLRPQGQITMMNGALGDSFYVVPWLDILGAETGLIIPRADFNYIRTVIYHKPFLTLLKGNYEKDIARPEMELFMKRCLAYGVYPGFFDWPPSGLGPGGQYWNHPRYYERDRDLFRKYEPLCRNLAMAGWEPVTGARSSDPAIFIERYGPDPRGVVWLSVLNEEGRPRQTTLTLDAKALGLDPATARAQDMVSGRTLDLRGKDGALTLDLDVPADGVLALQFASAATAAQWRLAQCLEALDRGVVQRQVDADKPAIAVHWRPGGPTYERAVVDGRICLAFKPGGSMHQWAMLFQPAPNPLKLVLRVAADNLTEKGALVRCNLAWVTPNYTHYQKQEFELPGGTYDFKDVEFAITPEQALRSLELTPVLLGKATGSLRIARVSLSDASRTEYVADPEFGQWYEPQPPALAAQIEAEMGKVRAALVALQPATAQLAGAPARSELAAVCRSSRQVRALIAAGKAESGCRRVLRDLETLDGHLGQIVMASYGLAAPAITGPSAAAPGDPVTLAFAAPATSGVPLRTELVSTGLAANATASGAVVTIPQNAKPGASFAITGLLHVGKPGEEATISTTHRLSVLAPLELTLASRGLNPETGAARLGLTVRNNHLQPAAVSFRVIAPEGWEVTVPATLPVPAGSTALAEAVIVPTRPAVAGPLELAVVATGGQDSAQARLVMLYLPPAANALKNGGFEAGEAFWGSIKPPSGVDAAVARSGKAALRLENPGRTDSQAYQSVVLDQTEPCPILVQASSKAENVEGQSGRDYSLYIDIYYTDGTKLYGRTFDFTTGTGDWQLGELYIEPAKAIRSVTTNLLLRGRSGKAWFDDVALLEDGRRKGNLARRAEATVDSNYNGYGPAPLNDGITQGEGLHWTLEAWASADDGKEHWIELKLPAPVTLGRACIYWSLDAGVPRTSQEVKLQIPTGTGWKTVAELATQALVPQSDINLDSGLNTDRIRLLQPAGKGPASRPGLLWVREVELFAP
jgi:hypothetical protein